jgi:hypothetical protein
LPVAQFTIWLYFAILQKVAIDSEVEKAKYDLMIFCNQKTDREYRS